MVNELVCDAQASYEKGSFMAELDSERQDTRVLLVDDQEDVLSSLKMILETEPGLCVVGVAKNGFEALHQAEKLLPQVVIMDVKMPRMDGLEATRQIKNAHPEMNVILLSMYENEEFMQAGKEAGASHYFLKGASTAHLVDAIKALV